MEGGGELGDCGKGEEEMEKGGEMVKVKRW